MWEWKIRKTNTRSEESIWERLSFLFFETTHGFLTFLLLSSLAAIFIVHSIVCTFEISFYKKIELHKSILSNRNDSDLRKCEGVFDVNSNGHITRSELWEYDNCISRINERRKEDEAQRKLNSLGIWKREQGDE